MKVITNLKSGSLMADAQEAASNLGGQVGGFFDSAEQQAKGFTSTIANTTSDLWQGLTGLIGL